MQDVAKEWAKQGKEEGREEEKKTIARSMLRKKLDIAFIAERGFWSNGEKSNVFNLIRQISCIHEIAAFMRVCI
jgi:predicted transposase YdaD